MNQLSSQTLAQIVMENHRTASLFEKYHLDFCCRGKRSLQQACAEQNIPIDNLVKELENISGLSSGACEIAFPFEKLSLTELANYIVSTHHEYIKTEAPKIAVYLEKVAFKHGGRHPELHRIFQLFIMIKQEMGDHMQKEELILFPRIRKVEEINVSGNAASQMTVSALETPILMMEEEHEQAGQWMEEIRQLTNNYTAPEDACTTYKLSFDCLRAFEADLHQHVHLENNILFPRTLELFGKSNQCSLN